MPKRKSTRLEQFTREQLWALTEEYNTIREEVNGLARDGLTRIRLPAVTDREKRVELLRALDEKQDLVIRISYAGNLNVSVRETPEAGLVEEGIMYLDVLRWPFTEWCVPNGRYFP